MMAQITPNDKNQRYRDKKTLVNDIIVCRKCTDLSHGARWAIIAEIAWVWLEFNGKYIGQKYVSQRIYDLSQQHGINFKKPQGEIVLEHLVPKSMIIKHLFEIKPDHRIIHDFLDTFLVGVLVLKEEDRILDEHKFRQKMPVDFSLDKPETRWGRYRDSKLTVLEVQWENNMIVKKLNKIKYK